MVTPLFYSQVPPFGVVLWLLLWSLWRWLGTIDSQVTNENHSVMIDLTVNQDPSAEGPKA